MPCIYKYIEHCQRRTDESTKNRTVVIVRVSEFGVLNADSRIRLVCKRVLNIESAVRPIVRFVRRDLVSEYRMTPYFPTFRTCLVRVPIENSQMPDR